MVGSPGQYRIMESAARISLLLHSIAACGEYILKVRINGIRRVSIILQTEHVKFYELTLQCRKSTTSQNKGMSPSCNVIARKPRITWLVAHQ